MHHLNLAPLNHSAFRKKQQKEIQNICINKKIYKKVYRICIKINLQIILNC